MKNPFNLSELMETAQAAQVEQQVKLDDYQNRKLDLLRDCSLYLRDISDTLNYINNNLNSIAQGVLNDYSR